MTFDGLQTQVRLSNSILMKHLNIRVTGTVQGVFFRASARDEARRLGLHGFVRNQPDGNVYIEAEGQENALAQLVEWCKTGPAHARVSGVEVNEDRVQNFNGFEIRRN